MKKDFWEELADEFLNSGVAIDKGRLVTRLQAKTIRYQIDKYQKRISFNHVPGVAVISNTAYIEYPLAISREIIDTILSPDLLKIIESCIGGESRLVSSRIQTKIASSNVGLKPHKDRGNGIVVIHYLTSPCMLTGATNFWKNSHLDSRILHQSSSVVDDADYIQSELLSEADRLSVEGSEPGTTAIFWQKLTHSVPPYTRAGRMAIVSIFAHKDDSQATGLFHILSTESIRYASKKQLEALGMHDELSPNNDFQEFRFSPVDSCYSFGPTRVALWCSRFCRYLAGSFRLQSFLASWKWLRRLQ